MNAVLGTSRERYHVVTLAHEFILAALPLRLPDSRHALHQFVEALASRDLSRPDLNAVLLDTLTVLHAHAGGCLPSLVERYLMVQRHLVDPVATFRECVEDAIRYRVIGNDAVQRAVSIIEERFFECTLTQAETATQLGITPQALSAAFKQHTGLTFTDYLRRTRLNRAAQSLATDDLRVKEVWVAAGYNDASNFDHQFKAQFGVTPRAYRAAALSSSLWPNHAAPATRTARRPRMRSAEATGGKAVLIVDDNASTRESIARYLRVCGYDVSEAARGTDGLESVREHPPRVVLLDYNLPDMDGIEWIRNLRAASRACAPPILLFTADWEVAGRADELRALGTTFVSKLCDIEDLERQIAALYLSQ